MKDLSEVLPSLAIGQLLAAFFDKHDMIFSSPRCMGRALYSFMVRYPQLLNEPWTIHPTVVTVKPMRVTGMAGVCLF